MTVTRKGRRFFLRGAGAFALAVPFLPSLMPRNASASPGAVAKRFVGMGIPHGGVRHENMWPADGLADQPMTVMGDHTFHYGTLSTRSEGSDAVLSNVLRASNADLSSRIVGKMNLLRGLDVPWYCAHGSHVFGNYGSSALAGDSDVPETVSIDQVMAYSPCVYRTAPRRRSAAIASSLSWTYSNADARSGVERLPTVPHGEALFNDIFVPDDEPTGEPRPLVVDRVLESYRRVRDGAHGPGARLGREDRTRLDDYMSRLSELQASLQARPAASCSAVVPPTDFIRSANARYGDMRNEPERYGPELYGKYNDVLVAAFMCDSMRVATVGIDEDFHGGMDSLSGAGGDGFHYVAHNAAADPALEAMLQGTSRNFFRYVFLDLINKLDAVDDGEGASLLDNSLVVWTNESGPKTHDNDSQPVVMAGSCGGALRTGLYVDYRDRNLEFQRGPSAGPGILEAAAEGRRPGLHYYQFLTTCLDAMGVERAEWPNGAGAPYTTHATQAGWEWRHPRADRILDFSRESLPLITV